MDFKEATSKLTDCPTLDDIARACDVARNTVLRARMDPNSPNARPAPAGWERTIARLARMRAKELARLADALERRAQDV
jgi:hypothetical protein